MFEEICLACGRQVDDGRAYCSDQCQNLDTSPSISSASSAFSSPHLGYAAGGDVPPLVPSALGAALNHYLRDPYSVSSSSASSTSWSLLTDHEEDISVLGVESDSHEVPDSSYEIGTKPPGYLHPTPSSALSYARRPSGTNNRSTIPLLHRRTSSSSDAEHVDGVPQSAPIHSHTSTVHFLAQDDESYNSDISLSPDPPRRSDDRRTRDKNLTVTAKPRRHRNRASLPAYFSLLQMSGSSSSTSCVTPIEPPARVSPPTPKLSLATCPLRPSALMQPTLRGRRREAGTSCGSRHTRSRSRSRSRSRTTYLKGQNIGIRQTVPVEQVHDFSFAPISRGRTARRNSSPPQKMILSGVLNGSGRDSRRADVAELGGSMSPGLGKGRSRGMNWERIGTRGITGWP